MMDQNIPPAIKIRAINEWLKAKPSITIANEIGISSWKVTDVIDQTKRDGGKDIDLLRSVAVLLKKNNFDLTQFALSIKIKNRLDSLQIREESADSFLENVAIYCFSKKVDPYEFFSQISSICETVEVNNIPLHELALFVEQTQGKLNQPK
ncbi:MAG: hypothetical protein AB7U98_06915 [Candidatus Nitrosocosmicus sp.]|nr:hypothetical protein YTPLAS21_11880 [Candidatus Nitrosocosmicus sp.]